MIAFSGKTTFGPLDCRTRELREIQRSARDEVQVSGFPLRVVVEPVETKPGEDR